MMTANISTDRGARPPLAEAKGPALFRQSAKFVQRILQGQQPNDLPIEQPTKFELAVNLKTAKVIGLMIPENFFASHRRTYRMNRPSLLHCICRFVAQGGRS
jgi:hypothetical protein